MKTMHTIVVFLCATFWAGSDLAAQIDHRAAFEQLKALEGRWEGSRTAAGGVTRLNYRVASNGSVVMEILNEAGADEMINMYHLVGGELRATHYCAGGNQPHLRLTRATGGGLHFALSGGEGFDPARDGHIHEVGITFRDDGRLDSRWVWYEGGRPDHDNTFTVRRVR